MNYAKKQLRHSGSPIGTLEFHLRDIPGDVEDVTHTSGTEHRLDNLSIGAAEIPTLTSRGSLIYFDKL